MKPDSASSPLAANEAREALIKEFRAYLHLVTTAQQVGESKQLATLPGSKMAAYCRALAALPDNTLAKELANSVTGIVQQISHLAAGCQGSLRSKEPQAVAFQDEAKRVLGQIDFALALILRNLLVLVRFRAEVTQDMDLLCGATGLAIGDGAAAARLIRYGERVMPQISRLEDGTVDEGSFPDHFAWDAYGRVAVLDKLADEFPDHLKIAARQMHAWPMLAHRHTNNRRRFEQLARKLELGAEYPLDATEGARYRPDTPLVQYLDPLICQLHVLRCNQEGKKFESLETERAQLRHFWWDWPEELAGDDVVDVLHKACRLPALTKATAIQWAEKAVVPLILATDARDWQNCADPALRSIARQRGVKSRATFKSRLLAAVSATLRRLARPA